MLTNYFRLTLRKLYRNKFHSVIHILGLTIGITSCLLLFLFIKYELSFDNFYTNSDSIYRFVYQEKSASGVEDYAVVPYPFGEAIKNDFPDIGISTLFHFQEEALLINGRDKLDVANIIFADSNFFKIFNYEVLSGDPVSDLARPNAAFLTKTTANKIFGDENPIGKIFSLENIVDFEVVGLLADPPANNHLPFGMVVSYSSFTSDFIGGIDLGWGATINGFCYVKLNNLTPSAAVVDNMGSFRDKYMPDSDERTRIFGLQPIEDIHFNQTYARKNVSYTIDTTYLISLAAIALLILSVACVNFINLASALAVRKSKEIGVRKTLGAEKGQIIMQFLGEALALTLISVFMSLAIIEIIMPIFNNFLNKQIPFQLWGDPVLLSFIAGLVILVTILSGLYPSLTLARYNAVEALKTKLTTPDKSSLLVRRGLVIFQFLISQALIIGTIVVASQMSYFRSKPLGFNTEAVVNLTLPDPESNKLQAIRTRFETMPEIEDLTFCLGAPTSENSIGTGFTTPELSGKESYRTRIKPVDIYYNKTYGLELVSGRWISEAEEKQALLPNDEDKQYVFVVNEALVARLGVASAEEALGREIEIGLNGIQGPIIGVTRNFHTQSFRTEIEPVVMMTFPPFYYSAGLRIVSDDLPATMQKLNEAWSEVFPEYSFDYTFLDDHLASLYEEENRMFTLIQVFSGLSIFIGCIGLFGLISFIVVQRMKEIGVRKVLGASVPSIIFNLSKEFIYLELAAFVLAIPLTWYVMNQWLTGFAYRIELNPLFFLSGLIISLLIALATVGYQAYKAALMNPTRALKDE